jgi:hypothetical protein
MLDDDAGKNLATTYGDMMPNMTSQNVDYGNQIGNQIFNQRTGAMEQSMTEKGLDPTQKYQSDASMSNARTAAGASNYATSVRQALGQLEADLTREGRNLEQSNLMNGWKPAGVDNNGVALEHNPYQGYRTSIDEAGVAVTPAPQGSGDVKYGSPVQDASGQFYIPANGQMIPQGVQGMPKDNSSAIANALKALDPFGDSQDPGVQSLRQQLTSGFQQPPQRRQQPPGTVRLVDATTFRQLSSEDMPELWQLYQSGQVQLSPAVRANLEQAFRGGGAY